MLTKYRYSVFNKNKYLTALEQCIVLLLLFYQLVLNPSERPFLTTGKIFKKVRSLLSDESIIDALYV